MFYRYLLTKLPASEQYCHDCHELIYVLQGGGKYIVEGATYPLHPHALLLTRPYEYHSVCPDPSIPYERMVIRFDANADLPPALASHPLPNGHWGHYCSIKAVDHPIRAALETLNLTVPLSHGEEEPTPEAETLLSATLTRILLLLSSEAPEQPTSAVSDPVRRAIEYLNLHLTEEFSLDALAKEIFISKYHLSRLFHGQMGASIFRYFSTKRMAMAQLLLDAGESATAVASRLGFRDYSTFYRAYRRACGEAPVRSLEKTTN